MRFREQRGGLAESMETVVEFHDRASLARHLRTIHPGIGPFHAAPYCDEDRRVGWKNVHVLKDWRGHVVGFTDGPLPPVAPL